MDVAGVWGVRMSKVSLQPEIQILPDVASLAVYAADRFIQIARDSISTRGRFTIALSGGSTPRLLYTLLTQPDHSTQIDWTKVQVFWGDERCVPPGDPESNYWMARQALLDRISVPADNIHRILGELEPEQAACRAEHDLQQVFPGAAYPRFDLVLLGLGDDGHTASLFPGSQALNETQRWVVPVEHTVPPPPLVTTDQPHFTRVKFRRFCAFPGGWVGKSWYIIESVAKPTPRYPVAGSACPSGSGSSGLGGRQISRRRISVSTILSFPAKDAM